MGMQCKPCFEMPTGADGNAGGNAAPIVANANTNAYCNFHCNLSSLAVYYYLLSIVI
jgi:hypothetical protein